MEDEAGEEMKIRRCQGWYWDGEEFTPGTVVQCQMPTVDGLKCEWHRNQVPVEWMEEPTRIIVPPLKIVGE